MTDISLKVKMGENGEKLQKQLFLITFYKENRPQKEACLSIFTFAFHFHLFQ